MSQKSGVSEYFACCLLLSQFKKPDFFKSDAEIEKERAEEAERNRPSSDEAVVPLEVLLLL